MRRLPSPAELLAIANFECLARPETWERLAGAFRYRGEYAEDRRRVWTFLRREGLSLHEIRALTGSTTHSSVGNAVRGIQPSRTRVGLPSHFWEQQGWRTGRTRPDPVPRPSVTSRAELRDWEWSRAVKIFVESLAH